MNRKVALVILDGWWVTSNSSISGPAWARTPFLDSLAVDTPYTTLMASEEAVGLPKWQVWNSEVGHSTLGTGRINYQNLVRISKAIENGDFFQHKILLDAIAYAKKENKQIHLFWLLSDGGVHSHIQHLFALIDLLQDHKQTFYIHGITDGRDTDPNSGLWFLKQLQAKLTWNHGKLASLIGRYYAMDRDERRERVKKAYDLYTQWRGDFCNDPIESIQQCYARDMTDEFLEPFHFLRNEWMMQAGDVVINFNFRSDRAREITSCLTQQAYPAYDMSPLALYYISMVEYDPRFENIAILFPSISLDNSLGLVLSSKGKTQLRIAETEKYPHVSFFFNGGIETPYTGEERIMILSPKVATYDLQPEMSAQEITDACIAYVEQKLPDFICLNYANPDMVGHTGVFEAVVKACETVDSCLGRLLPFLNEQGYTTILIADHGNADYMINDDGSPNTAHSLALVPCWLVNGPPWIQLYRWKSLVDIAPTILVLMEIEVPKEMTGASLLYLSS
jgi:2,3-bisphosphoglycerate-independent phosphoglycerate mutase